MWVWLTPSAEAVAIRSFRVGDVVRWACRTKVSFEPELPTDITAASVLFEDADYGLEISDDFAEIRGRIVEIRAAIDDLKVRPTPTGSSWRAFAEPLPGSRIWHVCSSSSEARGIPDPGFSALLVKLAPLA